jgi:ribosomal protein S28E/S33
VNVLDVLIGIAEVVETVGDTGDVWGPALLGAGLAVGLWRMRPRGGRHRTPSARWASVRTTGRTVTRTVAGTVRAALVRLRPSSPDAPPVSCADGRPAVPADGRPPEGGREDGSG